MVDAADSKSAVRKNVPVRVRPRAPTLTFYKKSGFFYVKNYTELVRLSKKFLITKSICGDSWATVIRLGRKGSRMQRSGMKGLLQIGDFSSLHFVTIVEMTMKEKYIIGGRCVCLSKFLKYILRCSHII